MGFVDAVKEFVGFGDIDYEDEMDELEVVEEATRENRGVHSLKKNKVVPINPQNVLNQIVVMKPKSFSESKNIADELKRRHPVIIAVGGLDADEARRVVTFVAGTVHGVDGIMP